MGISLQLCQNHNDKKFMSNVILTRCLREVYFPGGVVLIIVGKEKSITVGGKLNMRGGFLSGLQFTICYYIQKSIEYE